MAILKRFNNLIKAKFVQNSYLPQLIEEDGHFYIVIPRTKYLIQGYGKDKALAEKDFKELVDLNKQDSLIGTSWLNLKDNKKYEVVALVEHDLKWGDKYQVVANGHLVHTAISKEHILKLIKETSTQEGIAKREAEIQAYLAEQKEKEEREKALKEKIEQLKEKEYQEFLNFPFWGEKFDSLSNRDRARVFNQFKRYELADMTDTIVGKKMVEKEFNRRYFNRLSLREQREYERKLRENKEPYVAFMHKGEKWIKKITKTLYDLLDFSGKKREKHDEVKEEEAIQEIKEDMSSDNFTFDSVVDTITLNSTESKNFETLIKVADRNNPKAELNGVLVDLANGKFVATDTRRLSIMDIPNYTSKSGEPFILAKEQLYKLKKIGEITLGYLDGKKVAKVIHSKGADRVEVIDSKYPPYQRVMPSSFEREMVINPSKRLDTYIIDKKSMSGDTSQARLRKDTLSSLIFVGGKNKLIVFHYLEADEQDAELTRISKGYGYSKELKDYAKKYLASKAVKIGEIETKGNFIGVKFALNKRYFDNATTVGKESKIYWNDSTSPIVIETNGVKNIIMPLTIEHLEKTAFEEKTPTRDVTQDSLSTNSTEEFTYAEKPERLKQHKMSKPKADYKEIIFDNYQSWKNMVKQTVDSPLFTGDITEDDSEVKGVYKAWWDEDTGYIRVFNDSKTTTDKAKILGYSIVRKKCKGCKEISLHKDEKTIDFPNFSELKDFIDVEYILFTSKYLSLSTEKMINLLAKEVSPSKFLELNKIERLNILNRLFEYENKITKCKYWHDKDGDYYYRHGENDEIKKDLVREIDVYEFIIEKVSMGDVAQDSIRETFLSLNSMFDIQNSKEYRYINRLSDELNVNLSTTSNNSFKVHQSNREKDYSPEKLLFKGNLTDVTLWLQQKVKEKHENLVSLDSIETVTLTDLKKLKSADPTEAQKKAGNYKKHKIIFKNRLITIENIAGSIRSNVDSNGKRWTTKMKDHYGYFNGTLGADGDHIDVFINSEANNREIENSKAYAIIQNDIVTGKFDEHKLILGAISKAHAKAIYLRNYSKDFKGFGGILEIDNLSKWLDSEAKRNKK